MWLLQVATQRISCVDTLCYFMLTSILLLHNVFHLQRRA